MKIAIVTHNIIKGDGQGRVNYELARYLVGRRHEVHLYANKVDNGLLMVEGISYHHISTLVQKPKLVKNIFFIFVVGFNLFGRQYDVVHLNGAVSLLPYTINHCHFCHSGWWIKQKGMRREKRLINVYHRFYTWFNMQMEKLIYRRKKGAIVAVSQKVKSELIEYAKVDPQKIFVVYNGVDILEFSPHPKTKELIHDKFGLNKDNFILFFAGDLATKRKGLGFVLEALSKIKDRKVKLIIAGDARRSIFKEIVEKSNLEDIVEFIGFRRDMSILLRGVDAFIFPTLYEPCGAVVLEAMASGLPIITSKLAGASDMLSNMESGILLSNPTDTDEIKDKILLLMNNRRLKIRLGENARRIAENHTWDKMAERIEGLYYAILQGKLLKKRNQEET